jgi:hypothetical protein
MTDYKKEYYLERNEELTKALIKIRELTKIGTQASWEEGSRKIRRTLEKLNLSSSVVKG